MVASLAEAGEVAVAAVGKKNLDAIQPNMHTNNMPKVKKSTKKLPTYLTTVTPISKGIAAILFIMIPFFSFLGGAWYGEAYTRTLYLEHFSNLKYPSTPDPITCTFDAYICPDGSSVGRTGPNCSFAPCPNEANNSVSGEAPSCMLGPQTCPNGSQIWPDETCSYPACK